MFQARNRKLESVRPSRQQPPDRERSRVRRSAGVRPACLLRRGRYRRHPAIPLAGLPGGSYAGAPRYGTATPPRPIRPSLMVRPSRGVRRRGSGRSRCDEGAGRPYARRQGDRSGPRRCAGPRNLWAVFAPFAGRCAATGPSPLSLRARGGSPEAVRRLGLNSPYGHSPANRARAASASAACRSHSAAAVR